MIDKSHGTLRSEAILHDAVNNLTVHGLFRSKRWFLRLQRRSRERIGLQELWAGPISSVLSRVNSEKSLMSKPGPRSYQAAGRDNRGFIHCLRTKQIVGMLERSAKSPESVTELQYLLRCCRDSFQSSKGSLELA